MRPELERILEMLNAGEVRQAVALLQEMLALPPRAGQAIALVQGWTHDELVVNNDALVTTNSEGDYWVEAWCLGRYGRRN